MLYFQIHVLLCLGRPRFDMTMATIEVAELPYINLQHCWSIWQLQVTNSTSMKARASLTSEQWPLPVRTQYLRYRGNASCSLI